jgi:hypothetical protein
VFTALPNGLACRLWPPPAVQLHFLALKSFVDSKKVLDFFANVRRNLIDFTDLIVAGVPYRNPQYFAVDRNAVLHIENPDWADLDNAPGKARLFNQTEYIDWITVFGTRTGYEAVTARIVHG